MKNSLKNYLKSNWQVIKFDGVKVGEFRFDFRNLKQGYSFKVNVEYEKDENITPPKAK